MTTNFEKGFTCGSCRYRQPLRVKSKITQYCAVRPAKPKRNGVALKEIECAYPACDKYMPIEE